jgi:predicted ribosomally synthesized peptide with SipW-like signal peptide
MRKIYYSLGLIIVAAALAVGGTFALFSDTEISTGNIFTAGAIDLKVDHKYSMYDGKECVRNCVENLGTNLIKNGSFEVPEVTDPAKWQIFPSGSTGLEWTVEWNGGSASYNSRTRPEPALVEYHENVLGPAQDGDQYAELDSDWFGPNDPLNGEPALIKIHQDIATTPGAKYRLHYYYSPRPNTVVGQNIMTVNIDGSLVATHDSLAGGASIVWAEYTYEFNATGNTTKVEFIGGGTNDSLGIFLDNVSLRPYDCTYEISGGNCNLWSEKDLDTGDYFWKFDDVKPGDYGTDIISLHVFNNDAYSCMMVTNPQDNENVILDSEVGDITDGPGNGELSQFLNAVVWLEANGDNTHNSGETILYGPGSLVNMASMNRLPLTATTTANIGVAWCFGAQSVDPTTGVISCTGAGNQNIAQSDVLLTSLTAYAVQQRNNASFACSPALLSR